MGVQKFSKGEAVKFGWETVKKNLGFFLLLMVVLFLILGVLAMIDGIVKDSLPLLSVVINIVSTALNILLGMGLIKICLKLFDGEKPVFEDLFSCTGLFWKNVGGSLIYGLIVMFGLLLLIVPGIIWGIMFQFFSYLIVDKKLGPIDALKKSSEITKGSKFDLFVFGLLLGLINLLGVLALFVGLLVTVPLSMLATAYVYRTLTIEPKAA